jgi:hypothetical protein
MRAPSVFERGDTAVVRLVLSVLVLAVSAALVGCGGGGVTPAVHATTSFAARLPEPLPREQTRTLRGRGYRTAVPAAWHSRVKRGDGVRTYFLNSGSGHATDYGLAGPAQVGLTIANQRTEDASATAALNRIVGTPPNAVGVKRIEPIADARLAGAEAATTQYTYTDEGVTYVQSNLVAVTGDVTIFIEVDAPPAQADEAARTLATVIKNWRWTGGGGGVNS